MTAKNPTKRLKKIYSNSWKYCPCCQRCTFSAEKVEKVVNPPQNPVIKRYLAKESCLISPLATPIRKQPMILTTRVAQKGLRVSPLAILSLSK